MIFWAVATVLALAVAAAMVGALLRPPRGAATPEAAIHRDQLAEVERDLARGTVSRTEAERLRTEISRRLLAADTRQTGERSAPVTATAVAVALLILAVVGGALGIYAGIGAPGYPDRPLALRLAEAERARDNRPSQTEAMERAGADLPAAPQADADFLALMDKLRAALKERPDDLKGWRLLARNEAGLGNLPAAIAAQERVIEIMGERAGAIQHAQLAELMIVAAGGYVSPQAEAVIDRVLQMAPGNPTARYYKGLAHAQVGRPDLAFGLWRPLLEQSAPDAPWVAPLRDQLPRVAERAGIRYDLPERRGPDAAAVAAAKDMAPEDRRQMIEGMVASLSDRLATEGGPASDWARLIGAYGVLGETGRADAIWTEAQEVFAEAPEALATIEAAARRAGVAQ